MNPISEYRLRMAGQMDERDELALKLRQVLVEARNAAGLTQAELAKKLGRTQTFVSNYERGEREGGWWSLSWLRARSALRRERC